MYDELIQHFNGPANLARALGVQRQIVNNWRVRGFPIDVLPEIEVASKGKFTRASLMPHVFGPAALRFARRRIAERKARATGRRDARRCA